MIPASGRFDYVSVTVGEQLFGLRIDKVQDVFVLQQMTPVPLAPPEIVGLINLRGRVVTALSLRTRLGREALPAAPDGAPRDMVAVGIDHGGEAYALIVDSVGEVLHLEAASFEPLPVHSEHSWGAIAAGIHRLPDRLLVVLDIDAVLTIDLPVAA